MKRRASELNVDSGTPLPTKKIRLTPWQQHLKNYAKTEGIYVWRQHFCSCGFINYCKSFLICVEGKSASANSAVFLNKKASDAYHQLSPLERDHLKQQVEQAVLEEQKLTRRDIIRRGEKIFIKIQHLVSVQILLIQWRCLLCQSASMQPAPNVKMLA